MCIKRSTEVLKVSDLRDDSKEIYADVKLVVGAMYEEGTINKKERDAFLTKYLSQLACEDIEKALDNKKLTQNQVRTLKNKHAKYLAEFKEAHKVIAGIENEFVKRFRELRSKKEKNTNK